MSEMVERVARVLCQFTWETQFGKQDLDACVDQEWPNHTDAARLSIEAMREPTKEMRCAGLYCGPWRADSTENPEGPWRRMIDAALKPCG